MATPTSVSFHTLGCKLNFSETSSIRQQFEKKGYVIKPFEQGADVTVINTCSVTDFADRKCRKSVRAALRKNPESKVVIIGCYAQLKPKEISDIEGVDLVLGAAEKFKVLDYLERLEKAPEKGWMIASDIKEVNEYHGAFSFGDRTRSFLKIQDGCNYNCSFCTIPLARGQSRSDEITSVVSEINELTKRGVKEIVLTGVNIGDFGLVDGKKKSSFVDLLRALDQIEEITRFRISSIEPNLCHHEIIELVANSKRIVPHFHMPLQSANNRQLKMMRRRYSRELYKEKVQMIKRLVPHACIGADIIVGFPGENDDDFEVTFNYIEQLEVSYLHVFTYSERANTYANGIKPTVPMNVRRLRNGRLRSLSQMKKKQFSSMFLGDTRKVLLEKSKVEGWLTGFTDNYIKVNVPSEKAYQINDLVWVELNQLAEDGEMRGLIKSENLASASSLTA